MPEEIQVPPCKCRRIDDDKIVHLEECELHDENECVACQARWNEDELIRIKYLKHVEGRDGFQFRGGS